MYWKVIGQRKVHLRVPLCPVCQMSIFVLLLFVVTFHSVTSSDISHSDICDVAVTECEALSTKRCLGTLLPYQMTAPGTFTDNVASQKDVLASLQLWTALRTVPHCWEVVQPLLCAVYFPQCKVHRESNISLVQKPSRQMCNVVQTRCRIVEIYGGWPEFLKCSQQHFNKGCLTSMLLVKDNVTKSCFPPLVPTKSELSWYPYVDGCGLQCENLLFTEADHRHTHVIVAVTGTVCFLCTLFTVLTFIFDWKSLHRYPAIILFFINLSFFIGTVGWLAQFIPGARQDIVCRNDDTVRRAEPQIGNSSESASCTVIFVIIYYFTMAGIIWFVILAYTWHLTFRTYNSKRDVIDGRKGYFHLMAWSLPLVLTIVCLAVAQVDGDSMSGVCFVGYISHAARAGFVLLPVCVCAVVGLVFLVRGLATLIQLQTQSPGLITSEAKTRIRSTVIRISVFASCVTLLVILTFVCHVYVFVNESTWHGALRDHLVCMANNTAVVEPAIAADCQISSRPSLALTELHICLYFCAGVVMSSWVWQKSTFKAWKRYLKRLFCAPPVDPNCETKMMIDKLDTLTVGARQKKVKQKDANVRHSSMSFVGLGEDPFGLKLDLTSVSSREFSSMWSYGIQRGGSRAPTPLMLQRASFSRLHRRHSESDLQSVTSIWTQSQHDQQTASALIHAPPTGRQSADPPTAATQSVEPASSDSQRATKKLKTIRELLKNRVAPRCLSGASDADATDELRRCPLDLPVYNKFTRDPTHVEACDQDTPDAGAVGTGTCDTGHIQSVDDTILSSAEVKNDDVRSSVDSDATVEAESEYSLEKSQEKSVGCTGGVTSSDAEEAETDMHSNSNYSIASSDTAALSIRLDENYDPVVELVSETVAEPKLTAAGKTSASEATVRLSESRRSNIPVLHTSESLPSTAATMKSNSATQTSIVHSPLGYYQPPLPYPMFGFGGYLPTMAPMCEMPIWPPYAYPPMPWYYGAPPYDPRHYMPAAPPYCVVPPSATAASDSNQSSHPQQTDTVTVIPECSPAVTVDPSKPTPLPASSKQEPTTDKVFRPIATTSRFQPTAGSLFQPVRSSERGKQRRQVTRSEPVVDEKLSRSLLEMVELITPQLDSGTERTTSDVSERQDNDDAEDEADRQGWEAEERERQRIRRRHTRQWIRALRTDVERTSDTSV